MSVAYQQLLHDVAIRASALAGSQFAALNTTYDTATLTSANFKGADWAFNAYRDAILMAVADFAWAIADVKEHPWRQALRGVTSTLADEAALPSVSSTSQPIIGVWGDVHDAVDGSKCDKSSVEHIRRLVAETWRIYQLYLYVIDGGRIYHTRTANGVVVEVCIFNRATELTAFGAAGNMVLPDALESAVVSRALSLLAKDTAFENQAKIYNEHASNALMAIKGGMVVVPEAVAG